MATKEEYKDTIMRMYDFCIASNHPAHIKEQFTQDLDFLAKLAEEHFEEKKEMNFEYFKNEIKDKKFDFAIIDGKVLQCKGCLCNECLFHSSEGTCDVTKIKWLYKQHKKKYKLTQFEYDLLQSYASGYKFKDVMPLIAMKGKGYFKDVDKSEKITDILENCEDIQ